MISLDQAGQAIRYTEMQAPPPGLSPWIEHTWITRLPDHITENASSGSWKIVPDLSPNLLIHRTRAGTSFRLVGPRTRALEIDVRDRFWSVGVRLRPGVLPELARTEAHELADSSCSPTRLWGDQEALHEALSRASGPAAALSRLLEFLGTLPPSTPDWRARILSGVPGQPTPGRVASLAERHGISRRTLQSTALRELGMTPKTVLRIRRLYGALRAALTGRDPQWSRIAHASGYYDGAHLSREFRALMREEPTLWFRRALPLDHSR